MKRVLPALMLTLGVSLAQAAVWQETTQWNEEWENKYSAWVTTHVQTDMYTNVNSPFFGLATDCADMTYFSRAIFSFENGLPFALNTRWDNGSERISNQTTRFDKVSDDVSVVKYRTDSGQMREVTLPKTLNNGKLRAFLVAMGARVGTWSLPSDTYPVRVNKDQMRAGLVYLRQGYNRMSTWEAIQTFLTGTPPNPAAGPGHALLVHDVRPSGAIEFIQSTLPKKVRDLSMIYEVELLPTNNKLGFRRFIQPQHVGKSLSALPGFSEEQLTELGRETMTRSNCNGESPDPACFSSSARTQKSSRRNITVFRQDIMSRLASRKESDEEKQERIIKSMCGAIKQRADVILTAETTRLKMKGRCMDAGSWDNFSTPSRDEQIRQFIKQIKFNSYADRTIKGCGDIKIDLTEKTYSISSLVENFKRDRTSSNPNEQIDARWGFDKERTSCSEPKLTN
ncbi:hypothetical protein D3C87_571870 [compost metagenome]